MTEERERSLNPFDTSACEQTVQELYYFLDGELTEERRVQIQVHLDQCGPCVEVVSFEAELRRIVADRCKEEVPPELRDRIARVLHAELDGRESQAD